MKWFRMLLHILSSSGVLKKLTICSIPLPRKGSLVFHDAIFFLVFNLFYLQSNKMSISFCSHNPLCKHLCNYFQCLTLLKANTHYTTNKFNNRGMHISLFYEHIFTNTLDVKRTYNKLEYYVKV